MHMPSGAIRVRLRVERFSHTRQSHTSLMTFKCVTSRQMNSIGGLTRHTVNSSAAQDARGCSTHQLPHRHRALFNLVSIIALPCLRPHRHLAPRRDDVPVAAALVWPELSAKPPLLLRLVAVQLPPAARVLVPRKPPVQLLPHPPVHAVVRRLRVALELQRAPGAEPLRLRLRRARLRLPLLPRLRRRLLRRGVQRQRQRQLRRRRGGGRAASASRRR
mgnify:CR=1 FL=1